MDWFIGRFESPHDPNHTFKLVEVTTSCYDIAITKMDVSRSSLSIKSDQWRDPSRLLANHVDIMRLNSAKLIAFTNRTERKLISRYCTHCHAIGRIAFYKSRFFLYIIRFLFELDSHDLILNSCPSETLLFIRTSSFDITSRKRSHLLVAGHLGTDLWIINVSS